MSAPSPPPPSPPPPPPSPPPWPVRLWRSNPAAAWASVIVSLLLGAASLWVAVFGAPARSAASGPHPEGGAGTVSASTEVPGSRGADPASRPALPSSAPAPCADPASGSPIDCTAPAAWLRVDPRSCTVDSLLAWWGIDPELTSLLVVVTSAGGRCWAAPAAEASAAGARAVALQRVSGASAPSELRACGRGPSGDATLACSQPHEVEWVGGWRSIGAQDPTARCTLLARRYTNSALSGADGRVESVVVQGRRPDGSTVYRCALRVRGTALAGSLYGVGEGPLPSG